MPVTLLPINVTVGFGITFYDSDYRSLATFDVLTFLPVKPEQKLPPWADSHLRLGK